MSQTAATPAVLALALLLSVAPASAGKPVATPATPDAATKPAAMEVDDSILPIGSAVPDFTLTSADGKEINLKAYRGESVTVLTFISKSCPVSRAWHKEIATIAAEYEKKGVKFIGLMSNSTEKTPEVATFLVGEGIKFPILDDPGNKVADQLKAIGTPHMYIIDAKGNLAYTGAINDSATDATKVTKPVFKSALAAVLAGQPVVEPAPNYRIGCSIKRVKTS